MHYLIALVLCGVAAAIEGLCAGRNPMGQLKAFNQPSWAPPTWMWVLIGFAWYGICFTGLVRLLPFWPEQKLPLILLSALMLANSAVNIPTFRLRRLDLAFYFFGPYWLLLGGFLLAVCSFDSLTFALFLVYAVYQIYAAAWGYRLWKMNPKVR
jgi:tryptophan-rich sensory protein